MSSDVSKNSFLMSVCWPGLVLRARVETRGTPNPDFVCRQKTIRLRTNGTPQTYLTAHFTSGLGRINLGHEKR